MDKIAEHKKIMDYIHTLYTSKNADYGDSVHDTYVKYGLTSFLVRMEDKLNRIRTLATKDTKQQILDEKIEDTLLDLANYAIIAVIERRAESHTNAPVDIPLEEHVNNMADVFRILGGE